MSLLEFWHRLPPEPEAYGPALTLAERGVDTALVIYHPGNAYRTSNTAYLRDATDIARTEGVRLVNVPTLPDPDKTIEAVGDMFNLLNLDPAQTVFISQGGDGTAKTVLEASERLGGVATQLVAVGHKNDYAHLTNTNETLRHPELQLKRPVVLRPTYPLDIIITGDNTNPKRLKAYQSYGDGLSGSVINRVQGPSHREHPLIPLIGRNTLDKLVTVRLSLPDVAKRFHVRKDESWHRTVEFLVANTGLMAGQLRPDVDHDQRMARIIEAHSLLGAYATTGALLANLPIGWLMPESITRHIHAPEGLHGQVDGEPFCLPSGDVTITISKPGSDRSIAPVITPPGNYRHAGTRTTYRPKLIPRR